MRVAHVGVMRAFVLFALAVAVGAGACADADAPVPRHGKGPNSTFGPGWYVPASEQRDGDPESGYHELVNGDYVGCGLPRSVYNLAGWLFPDDETLPGRVGPNVDLPYYLNAFTTPSGVEVVSPNCLLCHAGRIHGELVVGLGDSTRDNTILGEQAANLASLLGDLGWLPNPAARDELKKFAGRIEHTSPYLQTQTIGVSSADTLAAVLSAHHDQDTLAWSDEPMLPLPPPADPIPVDVPPWWGMKKKNAQFFTAAGKGDHTRFMMAASMLCVDNLEQAEAIYAYFDDVRAFIASIEPPAFPGEIDMELAEEGRVVFEQTCAECHGTYGPGGQYPNRVLPLDIIGTDDRLATDTESGDDFIEWFNGSFYGETAQFDPYPGYIAPPLDGIWATAPYLHNGSVPTVAAVLDSTTRPTYWTRSFDSNDYDPKDLGWQFEVLETGHDDVDPSERPRIYDTTLKGYGNGGHTFGDGLTPESRTAVLEYLKTL